MAHFVTEVISQNGFDLVGRSILKLLNVKVYL